MKKIFLILIRAYQLAISPLFPPVCRFSPTCSQYAIDAINQHGLLRGLFLASRRLLRCHPFSRGGFDPVVKAEGADRCRQAGCDCETFSLK